MSSVLSSLPVHPRAHPPIHPGASSPTSAAQQAVHPALEPFQLGRRQLANRAVVAPMSRVSAGPSGVPTAEMTDYYAAFAAGGFAAVITEGTYPDAAYSRAYADQPGLVSADQQQAWSSVTDAVHAAGGTIIAQLMHAGALSQCLATTVGPSRVQPLGAKMPDYGGEGAFPLPQAMTAAQIAPRSTGSRPPPGAPTTRVSTAWRFTPPTDTCSTSSSPPTPTSASTSTAAGRPTGSGSPSRSSRPIRARVPADFVVGVRLSQTKVNDVEYRWSGRAEAATYFAAVAAAGADYLHIASEGRDWRATAMIEPGLSLTALARMVTGLPVIANGGMHDPDRAAEVLRDGHADLLALGGGALANPDWPARMAAGRGIDAFDHRILHPRASLDNAARVRAADPRRP